MSMIPTTTVLSLWLFWRKNTIEIQVNRIFLPSDNTIFTSGSISSCWSTTAKMLSTISNNRSIFIKNTKNSWASKTSLSHSYLSACGASIEKYQTTFLVSETPFSLKHSSIHSLKASSKKNYITQKKNVPIISDNSSFSSMTMSSMWVIKNSSLALADTVSTLSSEELGKNLKPTSRKVLKLFMTRNFIWSMLIISSLRTTS